MNRLILDLVVPYIDDIHTFYRILDVIGVLPLDTQSKKDVAAGSMSFEYDKQMQLKELITKALRIKSIFILEWACPRMAWWYRINYFNNPYTTEWRCRNGDLDILKWLYARKYISMLGDRAITAIFENAHIHILDWLDTTDIPLAWENMPYRYSIYWECNYITYWLYRNQHRNFRKHSWRSYFETLPEYDAFLDQLGSGFGDAPAWLLGIPFWSNRNWNQPTAILL